MGVNPRPFSCQRLLPSPALAAVILALDDAELSVGLEVTALHLGHIANPLFPQKLVQLGPREHLRAQIARLHPAIADEEGRRGVQQSLDPGRPEREPVEDKVPGHDGKNEDNALGD